MLEKKVVTMAISTSLDFIKARNQSIKILHELVEFVSKEMSKTFREIKEHQGEMQNEELLKKLNRLVGILQITDEAGITGEPQRVGDKMIAVKGAIEALPH